MPRHPLLTEMDRVARERRKASEEACDLDVDAFVAQVKALPVFKDCPRSIKRTKVVFVHTAHVTGGRAHGNRMVRIRSSWAPPADPEASVEAFRLRVTTWTLETIVHELVHAALPDDVGHGERFRLVLARAVRELWGFEFDPNPREESGRVARYGLDRRIEEWLHCALLAGAVDYPRKAAREPKPKVTRAALGAKLVEKRATHAAKMLARAEKRAKAAQAILTKWRKKVRYYETQAAKKGVR